MHLIIDKIIIRTQSAKIAMIIYDIIKNVLSDTPVNPRSHFKSRRLSRRPSKKPSLLRSELVAFRAVHAASPLLIKKKI